MKGKVRGLPEYTTVTERGSVLSGSIVRECHPEGVFLPEGASILRGVFLPEGVASWRGLS